MAICHPTKKDFSSQPRHPDGRPASSSTKWSVFRLIFHSPVGRDTVGLLTTLDWCPDSKLLVAERQTYACVIGARAIHKPQRFAVEDPEIAYDNNVYTITAIYLLMYYLGYMHIVASSRRFLVAPQNTVRLSRRHFWYRWHISTRSHRFSNCSGVGNEKERRLI